uniref:Uncharacterized protein n=1 Tax=Arundo donax TaxID=35708 RepID=A0A0A9D0N9_ARUDO
MPRHDNQISSSLPVFTNTMSKLNSSPSRKAFSVQDKVYALWSDIIIFLGKIDFIAPKDHSFRKIASKVCGTL